MNVMRIDVHGAVAWEIRRSTTSDSWVALCQPLNLTMEAPSLDDLHSSIHQAVQLLLTDLMQDGELDQFLRARGWAAKGDIKGDDVEFDVPLELIVRNGRDSTRGLLQ